MSQGNEVTLIGRKKHITAIRENGLKISGKTNMIAHPQGKCELDGDENPDWVIVATKAYDTEEAMRFLSPFNRESVFLSFQNGLDNEEIISRHASKVVGGVTSHGVTMEGPGRIFHAGIGSTLVGNYKGAEDRLSEIANALTDAGIETEISADIRREIWKKVIVNAGINPLTAIAGQKNGFILENQNLEMTLEAVCEEAASVAIAIGLDISVDEAIAQTKEVARLTAENKSSMLQDIEKGRRTEIDSICGAIARLGKERGIPTPVNQLLMAVVKGMEETNQKIPVRK